MIDSISSKERFITFRDSIGKLVGGPLAFKRPQGYGMEDKINQCNFLA